ncbi:Cation transport ATPase (heavy-metal-associated) [Methanocella conradii HZ254]|uniref:Cation transport ATPase (Heavy-metal-associated) n=1 Tax=Methanocella conradii (strain DSM 24694 / JCM 17849 / CGMCC 1.5162 / HZ254) TaxID=1041930 RepID=H8I7H7_METCZ|nr:cation transporter [Methanocella conradii]AFD01187.1 Cation transport ATPase (heavy-metal-associated) [Methanocella conradii HZ254]MDI6896974.1 cation transporter [Methanocella conradii]
MAEKKVTLIIEGMHCSHCASAIAEALKRLKGVKGADVLFTTGKAKVSYDPDLVKVDDMAKAIESLGYEVKGIRE